MIRSLAIIFLSVLCLIACEKGRKSEFNASSEKYATGFLIERADGYTDIKILNPWQGAESQFRYTIGSSGLNDLALRKTAVINNKVRSVICLSTTHIAFLDALGLTDRIVGVANGKFVYNDKVKKAIEEGRVVDLGSDSELDFEKIVALNADLILTYAINEGFMMNYDRLMELEQKVIVISEYLETTPLGQSEWLKVYGILFDKEAQADSVFTEIEERYLKLKKSPNISDSHTVFCNTPWKEVWYMPGGNSFTAQLIKDAGGEYLWKDDESEGSLLLDFEIVLSKSADADIWINTGNITSADQLLAMDPNLSAFNAFREDAVYNPVKRMTTGGGNDFYESGSLRADVVLKDLNAIFRKDSTYELYYYKKI